MSAAPRRRASLARRGSPASRRRTRTTARRRVTGGPVRRAGTPPAVSLDRLWAPWRMAWLKHASGPQRCLFCRVAGTRADQRDLVLARRPEAVLMLNRYPYASGHLMVAVRRHAGRFLELTDAERGDVLDLVALAERALELEYRPHGVNYGMNVGRVAGAGFPGHLHLHLVPRWDGDTNFMPAVALTRVLPETLGDTWSRLRRAIAALARPARAGTRRGRVSPGQGGARGAARG
jgi:ATP adenylyltransferase